MGLSIFSENESIKGAWLSFSTIHHRKLRNGCQILIVDLSVAMSPVSVGGRKYVQTSSFMDEYPFKSMTD